MPSNPFADDVRDAAKSLRQSYHVAYAQHAPMEPRAAVAEWADGKVTVWTATQNPFSVRSEVARAFSLAEDKVRVIVPDFGGGFGGKHSGETAVEAARLAQAAGKPVSLRWTREEEFTWAYFRPGAVIEAEAGLNSDGQITSWHFVNINSGGSAARDAVSSGQVAEPVHSSGGAVAAWVVSCIGFDGKYVRTRVFHGRAGGGGRARIRSVSVWRIWKTSD